MAKEEARGAAIEARGLRVAIDEEVLLERTDLAVGRGEIVALVGPNGSGKTTLLRAIAGLVPASEGEATVFGACPRDRDRRFRELLAALIGTPPLARNLTLREHLELVAASWGSDRDAAAGRAEAALDAFGIGRLALRFPHELSSGQQQLFALCLTLIRPFQALLLDEPEQRLDSERRGLLADILADRAADGTAVLMATHSPDLIARTGARTVRLGGAAP